MEVDLDTKRVVVRGDGVSDDAVREAIRERVRGGLTERRSTIVRLALFGAGLAVIASPGIRRQRERDRGEEAPADAMSHGAESGAETANGLSDTASGSGFPA